MAALVVGRITEGFPPLSISYVDGLPNFQGIYEPHLMINTTAPLIHSNIGGRHRGLFALQLLHTYPLIGDRPPLWVIGHFETSDFG